MVTRAKTPKCGSPQGSDTLIPDAKNIDDSRSGSIYSDRSIFVVPEIPPASRPAAKARRIAKKSLGKQETVLKKREADDYRIPGSSPSQPKLLSKPARKPPAATKKLSTPTEPNKVTKAKLFKRVFGKKPEQPNLDVPDAADQPSDSKCHAKGSISPQSPANKILKGTPPRIPDKTTLKSVPQLPRRFPTSLPRDGQSDKPHGDLTEQERSEGLAVDNPIRIAFSDFGSHENVVSDGTLCLPLKTIRTVVDYSGPCHTVQTVVPATFAEPEDQTFASFEIDSEFIIRDTFKTASSPANPATVSPKRQASPLEPVFPKRAKISPQYQLTREAGEPNKRFPAPRKVNQNVNDLNARYERLRHCQVPPHSPKADISAALVREPRNDLLQRFAEDDQEPTLPVLRKQNIDGSDSPSDVVNTMPAEYKKFDQANNWPSSGGAIEANKQIAFEGEWWDTIRAILQNALNDIKCKEELLDLIVYDLMSLKSQLSSVTKMHRKDQASIHQACHDNWQIVMRQCNKGSDSLRRITESVRTSDIQKIVHESQSQTQCFVQVLQDFICA